MNEGPAYQAAMISSVQAEDFRQRLVALKDRMTDHQLEHLVDTLTTILRGRRRPSSHFYEVSV